PSAVGEIGLDRWIENYDLPLQEEMFIAQLRIAADRNLPVSIHCLQAWGRLHEILQAGPRPACGFLLHSYGGSREMVKPLAKLGAYFSFPGYFAHTRKARQRETFLAVPFDRLLVETDAPDQLPPENLIAHPLNDGSSGKPLNHPANLQSIYGFLAEFLQRPLEQFATQIEQNWQQLFGGLLKPSA
ncbi:MAG TPA: TatD family hydrolase, partial [Verrucomicrobiae bacterium]